MSVSLTLEEHFVRFSCVAPPFYPEQFRYSYGDIRYSTVYYLGHILLTCVFPVSCPVLVRSLLNFQAPHADRESFEWQMR